MYSLDLYLYIYIYYFWIYVLIHVHSHIHLYIIIIIFLCRLFIMFVVIFNKSKIIMSIEQTLQYLVIHKYKMVGVFLQFPIYFRETLSLKGFFSGRILLDFHEVYSTEDRTEYSFVSICNIHMILFLPFLETLFSQSLIYLTNNYYIFYENYDIEIYFLIKS